MKTRLTGLSALAALLVVARPSAAQDIVIDEPVPADGPDHFFVPFDVPAGTVEIEIAHDDLSEVNVLDWGLDDPDGFRGWGGGNDENIVVGEEAASRSYLPGPIAAGTWQVVVGKVKVEEQPAMLHLEITFRDTPTLAPQPERGPYVAAPALKSEARWYAGDFHVHSHQSGDAMPTIDELATFARSRGLDFVELSDHNTNAQVEFIDTAQNNHPDLLLIPGVEWTTYDGHGNGIGAVGWVDHKIGQPGVTPQAAIDAYHAEGALFSINHPALAVGDLCFGCKWDYEVEPTSVDAVEIATVGWSQGGGLFSAPAIALWEDLLSRGSHAAALGGSDDHRAGQDLGSFQSPIGDPTTMVWATELSVAAILQGIRDGRTVVKLQGPDDPMIDLQTNVERVGDTVTAYEVELVAEITGGVSTAGDPNRVRFVTDGEPGEEVEVTSDPFTHRLTVQPPEAGARIRAEVIVADQPRTITSHVWLMVQPPPASPEDGSSKSCGCRWDGRDNDGAWLALLASALLVGRRRRSR